jgi:Tfp pilus assembly protein PilO
MKELISLLNRTERRIVIVLGAVISAALVFYLFIALPQRSSFLLRQGRIDLQQRELQKHEAQRLKQKKMLTDWIQAQDDLQEINAKYLYPGERGYQQIRQDLNRIFRKHGIQAERIRYEYMDVREADIQKVIINFQIAGGYDLLKGFLYEIETFPKFLWVEKIDFGDTEEASRNIKLNLTLVAYNVS